MRCFAQFVQPLPISFTSLYMSSSDTPHFTFFPMSFALSTMAFPLTIFFFSYCNFLSTYLLMPSLSYFYFYFSLVPFSFSHNKGSMYSSNMYLHFFCQSFFCFQSVPYKITPVTRFLSRFPLSFCIQWYTNDSSSLQLFCPLYSFL